MFLIHILEKIFEEVTKLDFVGYKPKFLYRGFTHAKTVFGGIISGLTVIFMVAFGLYFFIQLFERQNFAVMMNSEINLFPHYNMSKLPFIFKLVDGNGHDVKNDTTVYNWWGLFSSSHAFNYSLENCNISNPKHFGQYANYFRSVRNISSYNCIDDIEKYDFNLFGLYEDNENPHSFINIVLQMCQNFTNSSIICKSQKAINNILSSVYLKLVSLDYLMDHSNVFSPGNLFAHNQLFSFSSSIFKRYNMYKGLINYQTDYGFVFPDLKTDNFFHQSSIELWI